MTDSDLFGRLASKLPFAVEPSQRSAWVYQIQHLRDLAHALPAAHFFIEFLIPRMGRRADLIIIHRAVVFVIEYKLGAVHFDQSGLEQVYGYALDLKCFHEESHSLPIVPILVATAAFGLDEHCPEWSRDVLAKTLKVSPSQLAFVVDRIANGLPASDLDPYQWVRGRYRPTPTIVEAAQALYRGHDVAEISRSEAGAENLTRTTTYVAEVIEQAKSQQRKIICFITGVPGSGKTLAGLDLAAARQHTHEEEHAVFLSGNGPLVDVLREALSRDAVTRARESGRKTSKTEEDRSAATFIQNIHHFRDDALTGPHAPIEHVAIFDEAQRAWNAEQTSRFMRQKKGHAGFSMSEPEFLLSVMDRHNDWCAVICLVGNGQEINTGEAGIDEWLRAIEKSFLHWQVHLPRTLSHSYRLGNEVLAPDLHLAIAMRSFRAERLSDFVGQIVEGRADHAAQIQSGLSNYPLRITRELNEA